MPPSTTPKISGEIGKPLTSSRLANTPAMSITPMSKPVLLIANAPTTQNSRITA